MTRISVARRSRALWQAAASLALMAVALLVLARAALAQEGALGQTDIPGPPGSGQFGAQVTVLPNGNFVVTDPLYDAPGAADAGAVSLYDGQTLALISRLTGSTVDDQVGSGGVTVLGTGNFVVSSPIWGAADFGAATWVDATTGLTGTVSSANSLVGNAAGDQVSLDGVTALTNGNYVVASQYWSNLFGAATWGDGTTGISGVVSPSNSLVGSVPEDGVGAGGVTALTNGNYVVASEFWDNGATGDVGAVTWGNGTTGITGPVSASNSLVGSTVNDRIGVDGVTALANGNYVVRTTDWGANNVGAVTWGSGTTGITGAVSASNSLVGSTAEDRVGLGGVTALANGHYVVASELWDAPGGANVGAATWGNGTTGMSGAVSVINSLVGSATGDSVASAGVTALANGNYVVSSPFWDNSGVGNAGAVTWGSGATGISGAVLVTNSLVGSTAGDTVGFSGVTALTNGNYVVASPFWDDDAAGAADAGAVTWGSGTTGISGVVSPANSLLGSTDDLVGILGVTALANGNYVVRSPFWDGPGPVEDAGAATWGDGDTGITGPVSSATSLVGSTDGDNVGFSGVTALTNGNYVVVSIGWNKGAMANAGAATWGDGTTGITGAISVSNSLVGSTASDQVGSGGVTALSNGDYAVDSPFFDGGAVDSGAVTWASGTGSIVGAVSSTNSVLGTAAGGGASMVFAFNAVRSSLVVGRPADNIVTVVFVQWTLSVGKSGTGTGTVTSSPAGIACGITCTLPVNDGTVVTLTAVANISSTFAGWSGACSGTGVCTLVMMDTHSVTATFTLKTYNLTVTTAGTGSGTVSGAPPNPITHGTVVTLTATPAANSIFAGWSGACTGMATCVVTMDAAKSVTTTFTLKTYALTVATAGDGSGSVSGALASPIDHGTVVTLTAVPAASSTFAGWSGDCAGTAACVVTMDAAKSVTATFTLKSYILTVGTAGDGNGSVGGAPFNPITHGTVLTLTATPDNSSTFAGWSGDCTGTAACVLTMDAAKNVTATFSLSLTTYTLTVSTAGTGSGTVSGAPANPIAHGTVLTLTALPTTGSAFAGWSGDCTGTGACVVTMTQARSVTANFTLKTYALTVNTAGSGSGTVNGAPANPIAHGTVVTLTAQAASGSAFTGWSGACSGTGACVITMDSAKSVTATFTLDAFDVEVTPAGAGGTVTVEVITPTVDAGAAQVPVRVAQADESYPFGTVLRLTALPFIGFAFDGWGGDASGETNPLEVTVTGPLEITATFVPADVYLPAVSK